MKKRIFAGLLATVLLVCTLAPAAYADESVLDSRHIADGTCGENLNWSLDGYTLTITGDGEMEDGCPWIEHMDHIEHVVLDGAITKSARKPSTSSTGWKPLILAMPWWKSVFVLSTAAMTSSTFTCRTLSADSVQSVSETVQT